MFSKLYWRNALIGYQKAWWMVEEKTTIIILMIFYPYFAQRITQAAFAWQERAQFMLQLRIAGGLVRRLRPGGRLSSATLLTRPPGPSGRGRPLQPDRGFHNFFRVIDWQRRKLIEQPKTPQTDCRNAGIGALNHPLGLGDDCLCRFLHFSGG